MNGRQGPSWTLQILVMAVVIAWPGVPTIAQEAEPADSSVSEDRAAQTLLERGEQDERGEQGYRGKARRGCGCGNQGAVASQDGAGCRGRGSGEGGQGMRRGAGGDAERTCGGRGRGRGQGKGKRAAGSEAGCGQGCNRDVMQAVRALVHDYRADIVREIEDVPNGVMTVTRSPENPEAVEVLQRHVAEMKELIESGGRIRAWDPLFTEIFDHYQEIEMTLETLEDGVRVIETSSDPEVVKLIRAHARKVNEFVARGPEAVHEPTSLPEDYRDSD